MYVADSGDFWSLGLIVQSTGDGEIRRGGVATLTHAPSRDSLWFDASAEQIDGYQPLFSVAYLDIDPLYYNVPVPSLDCSSLRKGDAIGLMWDVSGTFFSRL